MIFVLTHTVNKMLIILKGSRDFKGFVTNGGTFFVQQIFQSYQNMAVWLAPIHDSYKLLVPNSTYKLLVSTENMCKNPC